MNNVLLLISIIPVLAFSQEKDVLRYFKTKESLVGVKNQKGEIVIPAQFKIYSDLKDGEVVEGETILFDGNKTGGNQEKNAWGYVYDRKGDFYISPLCMITGLIIL